MQDMVVGYGGYPHQKTNFYMMFNSESDHSNADLMWC